MPSHLTSIVGLLAPIAVLASSHAAAPPPAELFERVQFAATDAPESGEFQGRRELSITPEHKTSAELDEMQAAFAQQLLDDIKAGRHKLGHALHEQLMARYGTTDYAKLQGAPGFRVALDKYIRAEAEWHRESELQHDFMQVSLEESYTILFDVGQRARIEKIVTRAIRNGAQNPEYNKLNSMSVLLTADESRVKLHSDTSQALLYNGYAADSAVRDQWLCGFEPRDAGRATDLAEYRWSAGNVMAVEPAASAEGEAITLRLYRNNGGADDVMLLTVLPRKDYLVAEQREYTNLVLRRRVTFSDYRTLADGRWYPFAREAITYRAGAPTAALAQRVSGGLAVWSPEATRDADAAAPAPWMQDRFTVQHADVKASLGDERFTVDLPPGTVLYDTRRTDSMGQPMRSVVAGEPEPRSERAIEPNVELAHAAPSSDDDASKQESVAAAPAEASIENQEPSSTRAAAMPASGHGRWWVVAGMVLGGAAIAFVARSRFVRPLSHGA
jgi:hypothetical protein